eukprot:gnl/MRDRNA2_/MRDRNA2_78615_c0_seq1.p1 gnl/MRDRNA2_/MRDRNA2_78615_c0~~gnl/MRDRNA2_/MRDRNA2_78615_c0_seq1.p1  ORF type:complete len:164 (+),score=1.66 gnl/MRDRNA2_/MRDRNA2_78615_c0_seq1:45-494(+)
MHVEWRCIESKCVGAQFTLSQLLRYRWAQRRRTWCGKPRKPIKGVKRSSRDDGYEVIVKQRHLPEAAISLTRFSRKSWQLELRDEQLRPPQIIASPDCSFKIPCPVESLGDCSEHCCTNCRKFYPNVRRGFLDMCITSFRSKIFRILIS